MNWIIIVFLGSSVDNIGAYTFENPVFETEEACIAHVQENARSLGQKIGEDLGMVRIDSVIPILSSVYCLTEEQAKKF